MSIMDFIKSNEKVLLDGTDLFCKVPYGNYEIIMAQSYVCFEDLETRRTVLDPVAIYDAEKDSVVTFHRYGCDVAGVSIKDAKRSLAKALFDAENSAAIAVYKDYDSVPEKDKEKLQVFMGYAQNDFRLNKGDDYDYADRAVNNLADHVSYMDIMDFNHGGINCLSKETIDKAWNTVKEYRITQLLEKEAYRRAAEKGLNPEETAQREIIAAVKEFAKENPKAVNVTVKILGRNENLEYGLRKQGISIEGTVITCKYPMDELMDGRFICYEMSDVKPRKENRWGRISKIVEDLYATDIIEVSFRNTVIYQR